MPLVSMTGFAEAQGHDARARWRWEARSVNGRGLDVRLRLPSGFEALEASARAAAAAKFKRGNLQFTLSYVPGGEAAGLRIDRAALAEAVKIAQSLADETGLQPARIDGLMALRGVVVPEEEIPLDEKEKEARDAALLDAFDAAVDALAAARAGEGAKLETVLFAHIDEIERLTRAAGACASAQPAALRDKLVAQLDELLAPGAVAAERLAQEVALLAARADVREEIDRLIAHIEEARRLLDSGEAVGRRLDFLAQEFNREANTLCSKSADAELTRIGIELKAAIDQFREQAANVE